MAFLVVAILYTRLAPPDVRDHRTRRAIVAAVAARPGVTLADLVRELGAPRTVLHYHLRVLLEGRALVARQEGRRRLLFAPEDTPDPLESALALALRDATRTRIVDALCEGAATQRGIAEATGIARRLVCYHLRCLERDGLARREGLQPMTYRLSPALARVRSTATSSDLIVTRMAPSAAGPVRP